MNNAESLIRDCRKAAAYAEQGTTAALNAEIGALQATVRALLAAQTPSHRDLEGGQLYVVNVLGTQIQVSAEVTGGGDWDGFDQPYVEVAIHGYWVKGVQMDGAFFDDFEDEIEEQVLAQFKTACAEGHASALIDSLEAA